MCAPEMLAGTSLLAGVHDAVLGDRTTRRNNERARQVSVQNQRLIDEDAMSAYEAAARREEEEAVATAQQVQEISRQARAASGSLRATSGTTAGSDLEAALQDYERQRLGQVEAAERNQEFIGAELEAGRESTRRSQQGRTTRNQHIPLDRPNLFQSALRIGVDTAGSYINAGGEF